MHYLGKAVVWEYFQTLSLMGAENQDIKTALLMRVHQTGLKAKIKKGVTQFNGEGPRR